MPTHIAFLRAINLGATRKFRKDAIKQACEDAGFTDVETHINTGNVRVTSSLRSARRVETALERSFAATAGFEVPTIAYPRADFAQVAADVEELAGSHEGELARHYVLLLKEPPADPAAIEALSTAEHHIVVRRRACHLLLGPSYRDGQVDPLRAENGLGIATNRNATVIRAIAAKWC